MQLQQKTKELAETEEVLEQCSDCYNQEIENKKTPNSLRLGVFC